MQRPKDLGHPALPSQGIIRVVSQVEQLGLEQTPIWYSQAAGRGLNYYAVVLAISSQ